MNRWIKTMLGIVVFQTGLYRLFYRNKALIVLFHRVDDRYATNAISCSVAMFTRFCEFFKRYFIVVSMAELIARLERGDDISRHLVITFDDGYLDNSETAAVELRRLQLPACFFIATNFIGSDRVPWWDAENNIASEWMSWEQVRGLRAQGFELGAHTCNHVDLGVVTGAEAEAEIQESGKRLTAEVGAPIAWFSYPYGRRNQMTEENREIVRRSGYACCVSAFGGLVAPDTDLFRLPRVAVGQWHKSTYQFGFENMR